MINEQELKQITEQYGTPSFVFDIESLRARVRKMKEIAEGKYHLCYSIKANPFLIPAMSEEVEHLEVCSPGELQICEALKTDPGMIIYSGVNKTLPDTAEAVRYGVRTLTAESIRHMEIIQEAAKQHGVHAQVLLRLNSGTQFGMSRQDITEILDHPEKYPDTTVAGIHYFAGTQRRKTFKQKKELEMLKELFASLRETYGIPLKKLEYGPGLGVPLFEGEDFSDTLAPFREIHEAFCEVSEWADLTVEMGRFFSAECGSYLTEVMDLKSVDESHYCILDGGMNHVNYIGQMMGMKNPIIRHMKKTDDTEEKDWILCGSLCTTADVMVRKITMKGLSLGDILVFENIGAYSVTEGIHLFLSRTMPKIILREGENTYRLVRDSLETSVLNTPDI